MKPELLFVLIGVGGLMVIFTILLVVKSWRQVPTGKALVLSKMGPSDRVAFEGGVVVLPFVHKAELIDISVKTLKVACPDTRLSDDSRVDIEATCYVRINKTVDDVLRVAQSVGCERASQHGTIKELFLPKFADALVTVAAQLDLAELRRRREEYKDQVIMLIGKDLNGFVLDDVAIDRIEPAGLVAHDPEGRGRVERDGNPYNDEVAKLRRDVDALQKQVAVLVEAWRKS